MKALLGLAGAGLILATASMNAASLCNCCATGVAESCSAICAPAKPVSGQCVTMVDYAGEATIAAGEIPLYGISLRSISLEEPMRAQLESFRRLLEMARRGAEKDARLQCGISESIGLMKPQSRQISSAMRVRS